MVLAHLKNFLNFVKIEHTLFSLPLIYSGVFLASKQAPSARLLILVLLAAVGARTAALALNRIIDREIDRRNPRTAGRELASGKLTLREAGLVLMGGVALYLVAAGMISVFCLAISPLPLIIFTAYPYMKRFTPLAHFGVGLGLAMAPLGGWFAVQQSFENPLPAVLLTLFTLFWVAGFDIIYSTLDEMFDRSENLHSFTSRFGKNKALRISGFLHTAAFLMLVILFATYVRALISFVFLVSAGILLYLEHRKSDDVELAFFRINAVVGFAVLGMVLTGVNVE
ncbi:MAG: 4-hydroxybenzoate octaprenyltransferase [Bacteroidia bacterium]|nr:MAG: 4-hydroxybenzoate octaprenyltransferase [Bacteroidia bacterium]